MTSNRSRSKRELPTGGTVTRVSPQQATAERMNIYLDGKYGFSMNVRALGEQPVSVGDQLTTRDIERLRNADEPDRATNAALNLLAHRGRSEKELRQRLQQKGFTQQALDEAIRRVVDWGYLDDERFAASWVEQRSSGKPRSRRALAYELCEKGVDRELITNAIDKADIDEAADAKRLAADKWRKERSQPLDKRRQRTAGYLARRGYSWQIAKEAIDALIAEEPDEEE